jgi:hypothetical protein
MAKKIKPTPDALARAKELHQCEAEILHIFDTHKVTVPEAVFVFEKIKFTALLSDANIQASKLRQASSKSTMPASNMFR